MEKYGTDYSQIAPSDDVIRELRKVASEKGEVYTQPRTMEQAMLELERMNNK